jgi:hypothetical protein
MVEGAPADRSSLEQPEFAQYGDEFRTLGRKV